MKNVIIALLTVLCVAACNDKPVNTFDDMIGYQKILENLKRKEQEQ
jgi:hypothetical protein